MTIPILLTLPRAPDPKRNLYIHYPVDLRDCTQIRLVVMDTLKGLAFEDKNEYFQIPHEY